MKFSIEKVKFLASKHSPEIWLGAGIAVVIGGVVYACHKSRRLDDMSDDYSFELEYIEAEHDQKISEVIPDVVDPKSIVLADIESEEDRKAIVSANKDAKRALLKLRAEFALEYVRMYAPAVVMMGMGFAMIIYGHQILNKRNLALVSAYATLEEAFNAYRDRVRQRYGDQIEDDIYTGKDYKTVTTTVEGEDGKKKKVKEELAVVTDPVSQYARFFDEASTKEWFKSFDTNHTFLMCQQNAANDKLRRDGFLLLNTVYDMLGLEPSPTGAICGWVLPEDGELPEGDDYVDFGMIDDRENNRILLNFNCQGMMYDKIKLRK